MSSFTGTTITDSIALVERVMDYVSYAECEAEAKRQMALRHPDPGLELTEVWREFAVLFAANVAYRCAVEATKRARAKGV
jgi:hypothetical protein